MKTTATLCGTRRNPEGFKQEYQYLIDNGLSVLSPTQKELTPIDSKHLEAIQQSSLVWLYAPEGYIGIKGSMEIGFALANGIPIFSRTDLKEPVQASFVSVVKTPQDICTHPTIPPSLTTLQHYYKKVAQQRGYGQENASDCLILLIEELGELARDIRKTQGITRHQKDNKTNIHLEIADILLYLVHMANILGIDLQKAVLKKEQINHKRFLTTTEK